MKGHKPEILALAAVGMLAALEATPANAQERYCTSYFWEARPGEDKPPKSIPIQGIAVLPFEDPSSPGVRPVRARNGLFVRIEAFIDSARKLKAKAEMRINLRRPQDAEGATYPIPARQGKFGSGPNQAFYARILFDDLKYPAGTELRVHSFKFKKLPTFQPGESFSLKVCMEPVRKTCAFTLSTPECSVDELLDLARSWLAAYEGPRIGPLSGALTYTWEITQEGLSQNYNLIVRAFNGAREVNSLSGNLLLRNGDRRHLGPRSRQEFFDELDAAIRELDDFGIPGQ